MYACILIPRELSLVISLHPNPLHVLEMTATVWSNCHLPPGAVFYPDEGEVRLDRLETRVVIRDDDIRRIYGCYDTIININGQEVRHCNWVRFVKMTSDPDSANVISSKVKGHPFYQVIRSIKPNEELVVLFHVSPERSAYDSLTPSAQQSPGFYHPFAGGPPQLSPGLLHRPSLHDIHMSMLLRHSQQASAEILTSTPVSMVMSKGERQSRALLDDTKRRSLLMTSSSSSSFTSPAAETPRCSYNKRDIPQESSCSSPMLTPSGSSRETSASDEQLAPAVASLSAKEGKGKDRFMVDSRDSPTRDPPTRDPPTRDLPSRDPPSIDPPCTELLVNELTLSTDMPKSTSPDNAKSCPIIDDPSTEKNVTSENDDSGMVDECLIKQEAGDEHEGRVELSEHVGMDATTGSDVEDVKIDVERSRSELADDTPKVSRLGPGKPTRLYKEEAVSENLISSSTNQSGRRSDKGAPHSDETSPRGGTPTRSRDPPSFSSHSKGDNPTSDDTPPKKSYRMTSPEVFRQPGVVSRFVDFNPSKNFGTSQDLNTLLIKRPASPQSAHSLDVDLGTQNDSQSMKRCRERTWWPCDVCGKKFDRPSLLKRHTRTHTGEKPHACDVCGKAFSTSSSLNTHRRIHSGEKPHQCKICGKRFTASSNLYYHRMTHNKEKPHKCDLCSKSFPTPGDLRSHMYIHNGSWPYRCDVCSRGFSKQTNLKNHLLLHSGDKPHDCLRCGKKFALLCNLKTHMKTHENSDSSDCTECLRCGSVLDNHDDIIRGTCKCCSKKTSSVPVTAPSLQPQLKWGGHTDFSISKLTSSDGTRKGDTNKSVADVSSSQLSPSSSSSPVYMTSTSFLHHQQLQSSQLPLMYRQFFAPSDQQPGNWFLPEAPQLMTSELKAHGGYLSGGLPSSHPFMAANKLSAASTHHHVIPSFLTPEVLSIRNGSLFSPAGSSSLSSGFPVNQTPAMWNGQTITQGH